MFYEKEYLEDNNSKSVCDIMRHCRRIERMKKNIEIMKVRHNEYKGEGDVDMTLESVYSDDEDKNTEYDKEFEEELRIRNEEIDEELSYQNQNNIDYAEGLEYDPEELRRCLEASGDL